MDKQTFRAQAIQTRDALNETDRAQASQAICEACKPFIDEARNIMLYYPIRSEVDVFPLFSYIWQTGRTLVLPVLVEGEIVPAEYRADSGVQLGQLGVKEPVFEQVYPLERVDLCIIPGIAFTPQGHRMGYGAGYYDKFLPRTSAKRVAVCFEAQMHNEIPVEVHDETVSYILTEQRRIHV